MPVYEGKSVEGYQVGSGSRPDWVIDLEPCGPGEGKSYIVVDTVKGRKSVSVGDWVVKSADGAVRKMSDEKFRARYHVMPDQETTIGRRMKRFSTNDMRERIKHD